MGLTPSQHFRQRFFLGMPRAAMKASILLYLPEIAGIHQGWTGNTNVHLFCAGLF